MHITLEDVLLRDPTLTPEEILMSESQERMMAVVRPDRLEEFLAITGKWEVEASVLGEVTDTERLVIEWHGDVIVDVPPRSVAHDGARRHVDDDVAVQFDDQALRHLTSTLASDLPLAGDQRNSSSRSRRRPSAA